MTRRLSILVVTLLLPLAAATAATAGTGPRAGATATATAAKPSTIESRVRLGQARACLGLRMRITSTMARRLGGIFGRRVSGALSARELRFVDRHATALLRTYGTAALGGCLSHPRHGPGAARLFANYACRSEAKSGRDAFEAAHGKTFAEHYGTSNPLGSCMRQKAGSPAVTRLARTQVRAARSCHARLTADLVAVATRPVAFGTCIVKSFAS